MKKNFSIVQALRFGFLSTFTNIPVLFTIQLLRSLFWGIGLALFWILFYGFVPTYKVITQSFFYGHGMYTLHDCFDLLYGTKIFLASMLLALIDTIFVCGLIRVGLEIYDKGRGRFQSLVSLWPLVVLNMILLNIIYKSIVTLGLILLVIPGLIWAVQFGFAYQAVVDKRIGSLEALRVSAQVTKGARWKLLGFWSLILVINLLGYALFTVGTLLTMPATMLAQIFVYRRLQENS
jgi:hypothetical protein